ncbi:TPA: hypothetical protein ACHJPZ_005212, partial [Escherichia coli]
ETIFIKPLTGGILHPQNIRRPSERAEQIMLTLKHFIDIPTWLAVIAFVKIHIHFSVQCLTTGHIKWHSCEP